MSFSFLSVFSVSCLFLLIEIRQIKLMYFLYLFTMVSPFTNSFFTSWFFFVSPLEYQRKERLGERISALQQLVSPFGKVSSSITSLSSMNIYYLHSKYNNYSLLSLTIRSDWVKLLLFWIFFLNFALIYLFMIECTNERNVIV